MRTLVSVVAALTISLVAAAQPALLFRNYLVVTDRSANSVLRFETTGDFKDAFLQTGSSPESVTFGPDQNVYVSNFNSSTIDRYNGATGARIGTFATRAGMTPEGIAFGPDGNLYVVDRAQSAVLRFDGGSGAYIDAFVKPGAGGYNNAGGLVFGPDRNLYVTSGSQSQSSPGTQLTPQILRFDGNTGAFIDVFVTPGDGGLNAPFALIFGPDRNLYVSSVLTDSVLRYNGKTGRFIDAFVTAKSGGLQRPTGMAFGPDGNFYVASAIGANLGILRYDGTTGKFIDTFIRGASSGLKGPTDVVFYPFDSLIAQSGHDTALAADRLDHRIVGWIENGVVNGQIFDQSGQSIGPARTLSPSGESASQARFIATPDGAYLAVWVTTLAGGSVYVSARKVSPDGVPLGLARQVSQPPPNFRDGSPTVALARGKAVVCWSRTDLSGRSTVMVRLIDPATVLPISNEVSVSGVSQSSDEAPVITSDSNDLVAIAWRRQNNNAPNSIVVSFTTGTLGSFSAKVIDDGADGVVGNPSISANAAGLVMLAWSSSDFVDTVTTFARPRVRIKVTSVGAGGAAGAAALQNATVPFIANADDARQASTPQITVDANGVAGVVWQYAGIVGGTGIYGRTVNADGVIDKSDFVVFDAVDNTETFSAPAITMDSTATLTIASHKTVAGASSVFTRTRLEVRTGLTRRRSVRH